MEAKIVIHNVVASCALDNKIPLSRLALELPSTEYEPEQFPGLVYRIKEPKAAALIFNSGKIVCTGTKSEAQARKAIKKLVEDMKALGIKVNKIKDLTIQNIVAATCIEKELNLNQIAVQLEDTEYEPEQFPGLVYRLKDPKVVFLLFKSGKVICTGGKSAKMVKKAVIKLRENLKAIKAF